MPNLSVKPLIRYNRPWESVLHYQTGAPSFHPHLAIQRRTVLRVFFTPGWGMVLAVTGTLGGVIITQAANSATTWRARRKDRNDRINDAVNELIACGNAWTYAVDAHEENVFNTVILNKPEEEVQAARSSGRATIRSEQLAYGRALARVRLTCPPSITSAADNYLNAVQAFEDSVVANVRVVLKTRNVNAVERTVPEGVVAPLDRLVQITRKETGRVLGG